MIHSGSSPEPASILGTLAKLLFGLLVFSVITGTFLFFRFPDRTREPLPDAQVSNGRCVLWLVGSSSIHRWASAQTQLGSWQIHNRGIEGARLPELQQRVLLTAKEMAPTAIILYAGENDLADGVADAPVASRLEKLAGTLAQQAPKATILLVSMKPSPTRWSNRQAQIAVDARLRRFVAARANMEFVDAGQTLLNGGTPGPFYMDDGIHLSSAGYRVWGDEIERHLDRSFDLSSERCSRTRLASKG
ncbi:Lysophospholipase L1 [Sphingomonas sp. OV641]|jgi:lysophospholipase L1-like esterase|uniref:GDSL-type esterase/lipase family protein n=1 Tax=Sphingomonas sp. OV641 TaxID=1881068 RepID=UPI000832B037|nr:GDSL-type esterase/lipase family protein [Sphingomonas sp. OV641]SEJ89365.1 Lysophospholipase L1 [Sphingomonas sp. OV641]